jgi:AGCS family alanine or glycine:cation symporter
MFARATAPLPLCLLIFTLGSVLFLGADPAAGQESGSEVPAPASAASSDSSQESSPAEEPKLEGWQKIQADIDGAFGYLVTGLEAVLFFDFFTGPWTDWNGVSRPGWLGTRVPFVVVWLAGGAVFLTFRMGFINLRAFKHAIFVTKGDYDDPKETGEVTHFQALSSALSATVGLGNIAGVAIAVSIGGPGAVFWMIVAGLFGMTSKMTECTLGQMYRKVDPDGRVSGGPMRYLQAGLAERGWGPLGVALSLIFTVMCIGGSFGGGCAFQVSQAKNLVMSNFSYTTVQNGVEVLVNPADEYGWVFGLVMVFLVGIVIIGGIRRIATTAEMIVPLMCGIYVLASVAILLMNYEKVPEAFTKIVTEAFAPLAVAGGAVGVIVQGFKRAAFSNEAGCGSAAIAHSAAKTEHPVREGIVALLEPFIDTVVICTMTGLVIVVTGVYNNPEYAHLVTGDKGSELTAKAYGQEISWFPYVLTLTVFLFAYSTMISWSYYGERCFTFLFGARTSMVYRIIFLCVVFLAAIVQAPKALAFSDLMILSMSFPNMLGLIIMSGVVKRALDEYWTSYQAGEFPRYKKAKS